MIKKSNLVVIFVIANLTLTARGPHLVVPDNEPGIRGLFKFSSKTAKPLLLLAQTLLVQESTLSRAEREIIAAYVSYLNECVYCCSCHSAVADALLDSNTAILQAVKTDYTTAPISPKLKTLLAIASHVQYDARTVSDEDVAAARAAGATDQEIHDTVLIAAAFCMYNRYVDGLATRTPTDPSVYQEMGDRLSAHGYWFGREELEIKKK